MGIELRMGMDGLVHVALIGSINDGSTHYYSTTCGAELLTTLGSCAEATCVACAAGVVRCACDDLGTLRHCGFAQEIFDQDRPCRCCDHCAKECAENV